MNRKLRSRSGVTLSEMLVTVALLCLMTLAVSVGMSAAMNVYRQSTVLSKSSVLASTLSQALCDELRYAQNIKTAADGTLTNYTSNTYGVNATLAVNADHQLAVSGNALVGSGTYAGLTADAAVSYADGLFEVTLSILQGDSEVRNVEFIISPVNAA